MRTFIVLLLFTGSMLGLRSQQSPVRVGIIGLTHTHVHGIFNSVAQGSIELEGIVEPDRKLAQRYADQYGFSLEIVYPDIPAFLASHRPDAVAAFGTIYDHLAVVEAFAPLGIHVMVEKPLAVSVEHARQMATLAQEHGIQLLTNYETTWYPTNHEAYRRVRQDTTFGPIRKMVVRDGHRGPRKIGVNQEFLEWLTDPVLNGGGALPDFGCYGANLMTWLMEGRKPLRVTAITQQLQGENNPKVEDEALILLDYGTAAGVIHASWNWPIGRKDMEIYGVSGALYADNRTRLRQRWPVGYDGFTEEVVDLPLRPAPYHDPFAFLAAVVRGTIEVGPTDLSSLENNLTVVAILEAARKSASSGQTIVLE